MPNAVIVDAVRTPLGKGKVGGALSGVHPAALLSAVFTGLIERSGIDPGLVEDIIVGCVTQVGEQSSTPGRQGWLGSGYPEHVPSVTVERKCGSGQQAIDFAVHAIMAGTYDIVIAAGVESMSRIPMGSNRGTADPYGSMVNARYPVLPPQGISAELVAHRWKLTRAELDEYAVASHERAYRAASSGGFDNEIVAVHTPDGLVERDETIRPNSTTEKLSQLKPAFAEHTSAEHFPELTEWMVTAGNSSQLTDGASGLLVMSEQRARELGVRPRARIIASAVVGDDPVSMLTAPIPATKKLLRRVGLSTKDFDAFEVNEAFASVPLAWLAEFGVDIERLNPRGGAIALGHPLGASGCRLMTTLINHLEQTGGRRGLQTMCEAGGMANATAVELIK